MGVLISLNLALHWGVVALTLLGSLLILLWAVPVWVRWLLDT